MFGGQTGILDARWQSALRVDLVDRLEAHIVVAKLELDKALHQRKRILASTIDYTSPDVSDQTVGAGHPQMQREGTLWQLRQHRRERARPQCPARYDRNPPDLPRRLHALNSRSRAERLGGGPASS